MTDATAAPLARAPSLRLDGKRALVTGAGRGIGLAAASALADAGAQVALVARSRDEIESAASAIRARGQSAVALALDITDTDQMQTVLGAQAAFDILVNNAGTNRPAPLIEVTPDSFDLILGLNVRAM